MNCWPAFCRDLTRCPTLFVAYGRAVESLFNAAGEESLRRFELVLLSELGYRIDWDSDERGESIRSDAYYRFEVDRGFCRVEAHAPIAHNEPLLSGEQILDFSTVVGGGMRAAS